MKARIRPENVHSRQNAYRAHKPETGAGPDQHLAHSCAFESLCRPGVCSYSSVTLSVGRKCPEQSFHWAKLIQKLLNTNTTCFYDVRSGCWFRPAPISQSIQNPVRKVFIHGPNTQHQFWASRWNHHGFVEDWWRFMHFILLAQQELKTTPSGCQTFWGFSLLFYILLQWQLNPQHYHYLTHPYPDRLQYLKPPNCRHNGAIKHLKLLQYLRISACSPIVKGL